MGANTSHLIMTKPNILTVCATKLVKVPQPSFVLELVQRPAEPPIPSASSSQRPPSLQVRELYGIVCVRVCVQPLSTAGGLQGHVSGCCLLQALKVKLMCIECVCVCAASFHSRIKRAHKQLLFVAGSQTKSYVY